jgi:ferric-dicitrate binding protein FerR (iron transport regulator)
MSQNEHIVSLIAKQLQGLATPPEKEELQQWLKADAAHQQEYDDLAVIWQKSGPLLANPSFNADVAWLKLDDKIAHLYPRPKKKFDNLVSLLLSSTAKTAAAILILGFIAAGGYWWHHHAQWQSFTAVAHNETLTLPDQSVVVMRKGSTISYPKQFDKAERRIQLNGEAFFTVQHNEQQPFLVITDHAVVKVLGTSFLVHTTNAADEVVVLTGKVNVADKNENGNRVVLTKGQRAVLQQDHRFYQDEVSDSNFIAWKTGQLNFNNTPLPKVLQDISHYYGILIEPDPGLQPAADAISVTVHFKDQPLAQVLEELRLITGLQLKKEKDKMIFYRN